MIRFLKIFTFILFLSFVKNINGQTDSKNISLVSKIKFGYDTLFQNPNSQNYLFCDTWFDEVKKKEYVVFYHNYFIYFADITNNSSPLILDSLYSSFNLNINKRYLLNNSILYNYDVFTGKINVYDIKYLPDSIFYMGDVNLPIRNAVVKNNILYSTSLFLYDISNPLLPSLIDSLKKDYPGFTGANSLEIYGNQIFASCGNKGLISISYDTNLKHFQIKDTIKNTISSASCYQSIFNKNNLIKFQTKSNQPPTFNILPQVYSTSSPKFGKAVSSFSVSVNNTINFSNLFNENDWLSVCAYKDGYYLFDVKNIDSIYSTGYYKTTTVPISSAISAGAMHCSKQLKSGNIIVTDAYEGLCILDVSKAKNRLEKNYYPTFLTVFPNPSSDIINVKLKRAYNCNLSIINSLGTSIFEKDYLQSIDDNISTKNFTDGLYIILIIGVEGQNTYKLLINH